MGQYNFRVRRFHREGTFEQIPEGVTFDLKEVTEGALSTYKGRASRAEVLRWDCGRLSRNIRDLLGSS